MAVTGTKIFQNYIGGEWVGSASGETFESVSPESAQPVRLERRGHELSELEGGFQSWNANVEDDGRLVPEIARL